MPSSEHDGEDRITRLYRLRDTLAGAIDACESARDLSSLARQYRETLREIDMIEGGNEQDELAAIILRHREPDTD